MEEDILFVICSRFLTQQIVVRSEILSKIGEPFFLFFQVMLCLASLRFQFVELGEECIYFFKNVFSAQVSTVEHLRELFPLRANRDELFINLTYLISDFFYPLADLSGVSV